MLNLIAEFESLPHDSKRHEHLEHRIAVLEGWTVDRRIEVAMAHLNCPAGERRIESLSGGEKRRVAMCRAIVSRPDFLMLDEPTNHLDPESIEWVAEFLETFATLPDGSRRWLIWIKRWNFDWQGVFRYTEPVLLPKGTVISMRYTYDNSADNPLNPNSPPKRVLGGPKSTDEMADLWLEVLPAQGRIFLLCRSRK